MAIAPGTGTAAGAAHSLPNDDQGKFSKKQPGRSVAALINRFETTSTNTVAGTSTGTGTGIGIGTGIGTSTGFGSSTGTGTDTSTSTQTLQKSLPPTPHSTITFAASPLPSPTSCSAPSPKPRSAPSPAPSPLQPPQPSPPQTPYSPLVEDLDKTRSLLWETDSCPSDSEPVIEQPKCTSIHDIKEEETPIVGPPPVSHFRIPREMRNAQHAEESAEVEVLQAQAKKHEELGKKIKACLSRIEETGDALKAAVGPAYNDTQKLQVTNHNVDKVLAAISRLQTPLEGKADEERIIRDGPARVGVPNYLASLRRVEAKYAQLNRTPMRMNQDAAKELSQLLQFGSKRLQELFETILLENSTKIEPLPLIAKGKPFPGVGQENSARLAELDRFVASTQRGNERYQTATRTVQMYADVRGRYLQSTLSSLAAASVSTSRRKKGDEIYRQGDCGIGTYAKGVELGLVAEWNNIISIFGSQDRGRALEMTASKTLQEFARTLRELNSQIKVNIPTDCFLAYEIIDVANKLAHDLDRAMGQLKPQVHEAAKPARDTAKLALTDLLEDIRRRVGSMMFLPQDAAAIPFTAEVLARLQALLAYPHPLASILASLGDGGWAASSSASTSSSSLPPPRPPALDVSPDATALTARYALDTLETLFSALEAKSRAVLKQKALTGVFLANNVAVADRMARASELGGLLATYQQQAQLPPPGKLDAWRKKGTAAYLESWREPCAALMEIQYTNRGGGAARPPSGSAAGGAGESAAIVKGLGSKDKDAIKDKFKTFNVLFESLSAKHRELAPGMEREVRAGLAREIQAMIEPLYGRFWERYHEVDKGKGKYVRYDKAGLSAQLASLT